MLYYAWRTTQLTKERKLLLARVSTCQNIWITEGQIWWNVTSRWYRKKSSCRLADPGRRLGNRRLAGVTTIRACVFPSVVWVINRCAAAIHRKYRSSGVNKSIVISIIDRNVHRWFTAILTINQKRRPIRLVNSDGLTNIDKDCL